VEKAKEKDLNQAIHIFLALYAYQF
jgi:hypothetical protein